MVRVSDHTLEGIALRIPEVRISPLIHTYLASPVNASPVEGASKAAFLLSGAKVMVAVWAHCLPGLFQGGYAWRPSGVTLAGAGGANFFDREGYTCPCCVKSALQEW